MGEVVVSNEERMVSAEEMVKDREKKDGSTEVVRWEKLFPSMMLRVLLVEADDSTRQIIAALLRKCSYRGTLFFLFRSFWTMVSFNFCFFYVFHSDSFLALANVNYFRLPGWPFLFLF
uniref:Two-component response regulator-like PRR95 isoform X1 n=1 Tax=Rhizophora mucronata TaxID=61149 RepID=A0A2P2M1Y6_RHIMU